MRTHLVRAVLEARKQQLKTFGYAWGTDEVRITAGGLTFTDGPLMDLRDKIAVEDGGAEFYVQSSRLLEAVKATDGTATVRRDGTTVRVGGEAIPMTYREDPPKILKSGFYCNLPLSLGIDLLPFTMVSRGGSSAPSNIYTSGDGVFYATGVGMAVRVRSPETASGLKSLISDQIPGAYKGGELLLHRLAFSIAKVTKATRGVLWDCDMQSRWGYSHRAGVADLEIPAGMTPAHLIFELPTSVGSFPDLPSYFVQAGLGGFAERAVIDVADLKRKLRVVAPGEGAERGVVRVDYNFPGIRAPGEPLDDSLPVDIWWSGRGHPFSDFRKSDLTAALKFLGGRKTRVVVDMRHGPVLFESDGADGRAAVITPHIG